MDYEVNPQRIDKYLFFEDFLRYYFPRRIDKCHSFEVFEALTSGRAHGQIFPCFTKDGPLFDEFDKIFTDIYTNRSSSYRAIIDYLIQTRHHSLYLCEIKFSRDPIGMNIVKEMLEKIKRLKSPKYFSRRVVLIHVNGVKEEVVDSQFFSKIIDFSDLLKSV